MLIKLARHIDRLLADPAVDGVVVTPGTDTPEETAYFLNLTLKSPKPVVVTGSMRPGSPISASGPLNLYHSLLLPSRPEAHGHGSLVHTTTPLNPAPFLTNNNNP